MKITKTQDNFNQIFFSQHTKKQLQKDLLNQNLPQDYRNACALEFFKRN